MTAVLFMNTALLLRVDEIAQYAVPTLQLAKDISPVLGGVFSVVLLCGIFSTAAPMMWTVCSKLAPVGTKNLFLCGHTYSFGLGQLPFGTLVGIIYPYTGYLGILLLVCLAVQCIRSYMKKEKTETDTRRYRHETEVQPQRSADSKSQLCERSEGNISLGLRRRM